ncbi:MAG: hypothetical protein LBC59_04635 [Chitinispirillales bacterium]|jgi:hypothetical protein|nr:hypothetical protein [Chitinispirillales bacterium]
MNSVNVNIPVANLPLATTHQSEVHRVPMAHQAQNADMNRDHLDIHLRTANEAESAEGKIIDPKDHKEEKRHSKKRKNGQEEEGDISDVIDVEEDVAVRMLDNGRLIDLEA